MKLYAVAIMITQFHAREYNSKNLLSFTGIVIKEGRSYSSLCSELDVASQGDTAQEAKDAPIEAAQLYLDSAIESNLPYFRPIPPAEDPRRTNAKQIVATFPLKMDISVRAHA